MKISSSIGWRLLLTAAALWSGGAVADTIVLKNGNQVPVKSIRYVASRKEYAAILPDGTQQPFPAANVERVIVPKPAAFDAAASNVNAGKYAEAITALESIVKEYVGLEWDVEAADLLGLAYIGKNDGQKAVRVYKELFEGRPAERIPPVMRRHYWEAMKAAEMFSALKTELDKVIAGSSRELAAMAQLLRGDMYLAQGQKNEALYDYLRTAILYERAQETQPEALFKASQILDEMRDPRGAELKKKLVQDYGTSPFAKRAAGG